MNQTGEAADVLIAGAGPAGMMLALLLAKRGVKVLVCERNPDFEREFRGEVLMPRFSQMLAELNLLSYIESKPHLKFQDIRAFYRGRAIARFSMKRIAPQSPYATWMPQPILLAALEEKARAFPSFRLWFGAPVVSLLKDGERVTGAVVQREGKKIEVRAKVVVGADGRASVVKKSGRFETEYEQHDFDLIWFNVKKPADDPNNVRAFFSRRHNYLVLPKYPDLLQCGIIVPPGGFAHYTQAGIGSMREELLDAHPLLHDFARSIRDFSPFSVLQARVHFVKDWGRDGCLLIGDAAHTCSPAGAIGVSVAVQTAIIAADVLWRAVEKNDFSDAALSEVQSRRGEDVREIQRLQKFVTGLVFPRNPVLIWLAPALIAVATRTPAVLRIQRRIFVKDRPLAIDPAFRF